jgi:hypothetical protein
MWSDILILGCLYRKHEEMWKGFAIYKILNGLSDVKDALDNLNAINQHSVHMHLFGQ